jgi:hypothetical protein
MLQNYKEIFFGLAFGIAAVLIDTGMDALAEGNSLADEVAGHPSMMLYRAVFILLGLGLGWLLWNRNRREREYRQLAETLRNIQLVCEKESLLVRSTLQNLLIRHDVQLSDEAAQMVQQAYQKTEELQRVAGLKVPGLDG